MKLLKNYLFLLAFTFLACNSQKQEKAQSNSIPLSPIQSLDSIVKEKAQPKELSEKKESVIDLSSLADSSFINLKDFEDLFSFDMRYASKNNFLEEVVYDCDNCWLRVKVAKALMQANNDFVQKGYSIKFYDCFRPREVQYKMWEILPDGRYVANPKTGSIHNRGAAVDITLIYIETGEELNMGTDFDHFGVEAHMDNKDLPQEVLANRTLLKSTMEASGFSGIRTEWWHFNLKGEKYPISSQALCDE